MDESGTEAPAPLGEEPQPQPTPQPAPSTSSGPTHRKLFQFAFTVAIAVLLALAVQSYAVKPYEIPSGSMEPTLDIGQRVLVDRFSSRVGADPDIGDVTVFKPPVSAVPEEQTGAGLPECAATDKQRASGQACNVIGAEPADQAFIKRVVAGPGDRIKILDGIPIVNGEKVEGDWKIIPCRRAAGCDFPKPITVPEDSYFMMGDNRPGSDDSRFWGPVPRSWIIGHAVASYWPPSRIGGL